MTLGTFERLQRIFVLADEVVDELVREETEILEKTTQRTLEVMERVAKFSCDYVQSRRGGKQSSFLDLASAECNATSG